MNPRELKILGKIGEDWARQSRILARGRCPNVIEVPPGMSVFALLNLENSPHFRRADLAWPGIMARPACRGASNQAVAMRALADEVGVDEGVGGGISLEQEWPFTIGLILR